MNTFKNKKYGHLKIVFWVFSPILLILLLTNFGIAFAQLDSDMDTFETIYEDDFSDESTTEWDLNPIQTDQGSIDFSITDGTYRWNMNAQKSWLRYYFIPSKISLPEDGFRISVDIQFESACSGCAAGIVYNRQDGNNYYFAKLDSEGIASLYAMENHKWNLLSEKIQSQKFDPSGFNNMTVVFDQGNYEIRINDIPTIQLSDNRFHGGNVGVAIEGGENTNPITRFDNLIVMKKKSFQAEKKAEAEVSKLDSDIDSFETIYEDDFSNETTNWYLNPIQGDWGSADFSITDGTYRWEMNLEKNQYRYNSIPSTINLPEDYFRISVDIQFESACSGCDAGILFNLQDKDNFYFARIDSEGIASLNAKENNKWILLSEKIQSQKFDPSGFNNMTVVFDQGNYEIRINDIPTVQLSDNRFHGGNVALLLEGDEKTNPIIRFDNLKVMKKKSVQAEKKAEAEVSKLDSDIDSFETIYEDDFSDESTTEWDLNPIQTDRGSIDFSITDGTYRWNMDAQKGWFSYNSIPSKINLPEDGFRIGVDIQFESTCDSCAAGIVYNLQDSRNYYFARLNAQGLVCVYSLEDNKWNLLSEMIQSQKFDPSGFNNLTVVFDQGNYEIRMNDIPTIQLSDNRFQGGNAGVAIEGGENTNPITRFDNLIVMKKKSVQPVEQSKEKTNVSVKSEFERESSARLNQVVNPMNDFYPPQENVAFTKFFLDFSSPVTFWREGRGDIFCLKESGEKACVFIVQHFNNWDSPKAAADDILDKYAQQIKNIEFFDQHETFSADGYPAYRVGAHFSIDGINYETDHLFIQVNDKVFQIMSYATRGVIEKYRQDLNHIMESFSLSLSE